MNLWYQRVPLYLVSDRFDEHNCMNDILKEEYHVA